MKIITKKSMENKKYWDDLSHKELVSSIIRALESGDTIRINKAIGVIEKIRGMEDWRFKSKLIFD